MPRSLVFPIVFERLPVEIICHILDNLEMHDLLTCTTVSKHLKKVVQKSSELQYIIELDKARMVSVLPQSTSLPFSSRLKLLRERERNWKYMNWKKRYTLNLPPTGSVYEFVGGLYGNGREDDSRVTASISFLELPSTDSSFLGEPQEELKTWTHDMEDVNIIDFTMDPSQDLLVLVALAPANSKYVYELHLRSIETNQPHHNAPVSILPCWEKPSTPVQSSDLIAGVRVQVAGNLVALLIKEIQEGSAAHLEIWNWKTNPQYSCSLTRQSGIDDFTFLTHDTFLVVRPIGRFEVYTFDDPSLGKTKPELRVTYGFPPLSPGYMYWYISMSSNPAPGYVPGHRKPGPELGNKRQLYYPRPEERIHACCLYIFNPASEENAHVHSFVFFLNLQTLMNPHTEWIEKTQPSNSSKISKPKRPHERSQNDDPFAGSDPDAIAGSSSSSPTSLEIPIHGIASDVFTDQDGNPIPFIPTYAPPYPLFPTFDDFRPAHYTLPRQHTHRTPRIKSYEGRPRPRPPPQPTPRTRPATSPVKSIRQRTEIPWEIWGPQSTRWFEECLSTDWQHAIYGLRTVESVNPNHPRQNRPVVVNTNPPPPPSFMSPTHANGINGNAVASSSTVAPSAAGPSVVQPAQSSTPVKPSENEEAGQGDEHVEGEPEGDENGDGGGDIGPAEPARPRRFLRVRDFNPYSFGEKEGAHVPSKKPTTNGLTTSYWRQPRLVTEASTIKGVFTKDIVSSLPYMEILSQEAFEVTDVMMDDCRLLLLKRGQAGKLKRVEVLMM